MKYLGLIFVFILSQFSFANSGKKIFSDLGGDQHYQAYIEEYNSKTFRKLYESLIPAISNAFGLETTNLLIRDVSECLPVTKYTRAGVPVSGYELIVKTCYEVRLNADDRVPGAYTVAEELRQINEFYQVIDANGSGSEWPLSLESCENRRQKIIAHSELHRQLEIAQNGLDFFSRCLEL